MKLAHFLIALSFFFTISNCIGQTKEKDSLSSILKSLTEKNEQYVDVLNQLAYSNLNSQPTKTLQLAEEANSIAINLNYQNGIARSYAMKAAYYWTLNNLSENIKYNLLALDIYKVNNNKIGVSTIYNNMAEAYAREKNYEKALEYHLVGVDYRKRELPESAPVLSLHNIGEIYYKIKNYDKALEYQMEALKAAQAENDKKVIAYCHLGIANVYADTNNSIKALNNYQIAIQGSSSLKDSRLSGMAYSKLGELYLKNTRYDSALICFLQSNSYADVINALDLKSENYKNIGTLYYSLKDYKSAYENKEVFMQLNDSLFNSAKNKELAKLESSFDKQLKDSENELLKKDNEIQKARIQEQSKTIIIGIMSILFLFVVSMVIHQQKKGKDKDNEILRLKNVNIQKQKEEFELKSSSLSTLNQQLSNVNEVLEDEVKKRTIELENKNKILTDYAHMNAHNLRSPLANILGLVNLVETSDDPNDHKEIIPRLKIAADELNNVVIDIRKTLEQDHKDLPKVN